MPQVQVPKGDGKRCSPSHSRTPTVMIAYQVQNACRATGAYVMHYTLDNTLPLGSLQTCYDFSHFLLYIQKRI